MSATLAAGAWPAVGGGDIVWLRMDSMSAA
jgi:hypothetical protein